MPRSCAQSEAKPPVLSPQASMTLIYRLTEGMKGRVYLDQPGDPWTCPDCGNPAVLASHYYPLLNLFAWSDQQLLQSHYIFQLLTNFVPKQNRNRRDFRIE
ncbi:hypothetical protein TNCV_1595531 [Trichonephila clavipes]|nr:hypothetical protein TNCV_1595531 [Trichonephila clavipes]